MRVRPQRVAELVARDPSAGELAAAVRFGQEDDVTVLRLCYAGRDASGMAAGLAEAAERAAVI